MFTNISGVFLCWAEEFCFGLVLGGTIKCWALPPTLGRTLN
jgi:hypothetical protein